MPRGWLGVPAHLAGMSPTQHRRPAGSPASTGGQFAAGQQDESTVDLTSPASTAVLDRTPVSDEVAAEVFDRVDRVARASDRRTGLSRQVADLDVEDVRQEALAQWLHDRQHGRRAIEDDAAYARTSAYFVAARYGDRMRAEDRRANRMLRAWEDEFTQQHGRLPSIRERDAQAQTILSRWADRRHLPSRDFHQRSISGQERPWSGYLTEDGDDPLANRAVAGDSSSVHTTLNPSAVDVDESRPVMSVEAGSWTAAALSLADGSNGEKRQAVQARRISCAALAEARQAPMPQVGCLSHAAAASANTRLYRYPGGVSGAIATWRSGETDPGTDALFAPFGGDIDEAQRDQVCDLLELGDPKTLWNSAAWISDEHNTATVRRIVAKAG